MAFDLRWVMDGVAGTRFAGAVRHLEVTGSTSTLAMEAAVAGGGEGVWVADAQTAGRGRGGHGWHSAAGEGLYASALVRPAMRREEATVLPLAVGLAVRAAVMEVTGRAGALGAGSGAGPGSGLGAGLGAGLGSGLRVQRGSGPGFGLVPDLRWPNDLLLRGRKFGGILVETSGGAAGEDRGGLRFAVVGVGVNVRHREFPGELAEVATSLWREGATAVGREELLVALLRSLEGELQALEGPDGVAEVLRRFGEASSWVEGKRVRVGEGAESYAGVTRGLTGLGFLRVMGEDGVERTVYSGGVRER